MTVELEAGRREQLCHRAVHEWGAVQHAGELAQLLGWLERRPGPFELALEVGVYRGGTMLLWHELGAFVVGVDIGLECRPCELRQAHSACPYDRAARAGVLLEGDSHSLTVRRQAERMLDGPADFLHIDGDHSRESVSRDLELYRPLVRKGGAVALHDVVYDERIAALWADELADRRGAFVIHEPGGFGIGVLPC